MNLARWCLIAVALTSCCIPRSYEGDGDFSDLCGTSEWSFWGRSRYALDLGPLDLSRTNSRTFHVGTLPASRMWFAGIDVDVRSPLPEGVALDTAVIELQLTNDRGQRVLDVKAPASSWIWEHAEEDGRDPAFLYMGGEKRDVRTADGNWRPEPLGVLAEGGWGTYFDPERGSKYSLVVHVHEPDPDARYFSARIQIRGNNYVPGP